MAGIKKIFTKQKTDEESLDITEKLKIPLDREEIVKKLNGTTLMVYFVLLNKITIGVRELQRHLNLSSPSVARYHLEKLTELQLVQNNNGEYLLIRKAELPILTSWILLGRWLLPRVLFAAIFFTLFFLGYLIFIFRFWNRDSAVLIFMNLGFLIYLWYEVVAQIRNKPI